MLRVGVTGGIGSGKSTVCQIFAQLGVPVYEADKEAKALYNEDASLREPLIYLFGPEVYQGGQFQAGVVRKRLFDEPTLREQLNALVHPRVFARWDAWCAERQGEGHSYAIKEAAILFESGADKTVDTVVGVLANTSVRLDRVMQRDGLDEAAIEARMNAQWPQERWEPLCQHLIQNNGSESLIEQVLTLHNQFNHAR
ncbi:MAG: dephospho-CoA kinase [Bacteroidetes bacterium]|nr:dephospho-CoA kinase [Bacteroidota bacterium]MDA0943637.1 dephospho-CoA kinase [Bacteroidota bacterium]